MKGYNPAAVRFNLRLVTGMLEDLGNNLTAGTTDLPAAAISVNILAGAVKRITFESIAYEENVREATMNAPF